MALADKIVQGSHHEAEPLIKKLAGMVAVVAGQERWTREKAPVAEPDGTVERSQIEIPSELELTFALKELAQKERQATIPAPPPNEQMKRLVGLAKTAEARIVELEQELGLAQAELGRRESDNHSLQKSLGLIASENSRLSCHLAESQAAGGRACSDLAEMKAALAGPETSPGKLAKALDASKTRYSEAAALYNYLSGLSSRTVAAGMPAAEASQRLPECGEANGSVAGENVHVFRRFAKNEAGKIGSQLITALNTTATERNKLALAIGEMNEKRNTETNTVKTCPQTMSSDTLTTDELLAQVRNSLIAQLELLQKSRQAKAGQIEDVERSSSRHSNDVTTIPIALDTRAGTGALATRRGTIILLAERGIEPTVGVEQRGRARSTEALACTITF